jgi:RND family efflux transporter MFP subunit
MLDMRYTTRNTIKELCLTTGVLVALTGCGGQAAEPGPVIRPVKTVLIGDTTAGTGRTFPGTLRASERARLSFRVSGPLIQLPAREGMEIKRDQLLAKIDPRDFETRVSNIEAQLASLQAQRKAMDQARPEDIRRSEANLAAARASLLEANANFRRYQRLYENDNVSKAEFDQRRASQQIAEANVDSAGEQLKIAREGSRVEDIAAMDARIDALRADHRKAKDDLRDTSLLAPYSGIVAERYVDNFEFVQAQAPIVSLQNIEMMELVAQISETVIAQYRRGGQGKASEFFATFPSLPNERLRATVTEVSTEADPITRTYSVVFRVPQPLRGTILAGMTGEVHLSQEEGSEPTFTVPVAAVITDPDGQPHVWKLDKPSMAVRKAPVDVGEMVGESIMITRGLSRGDTVVTAGAAFLNEEMKVREVTSELRDRR